MSKFSVFRKSAGIVLSMTMLFGMSACGKHVEAVITDELSKGGEVTLTGFGTFKVTDRAARTGRNPQTGAEIQIAASKAPTFKAGKALKEAVN